MKEAAALGLAEAEAVYVGAQPLSGETAVTWLQVLGGDGAAPEAEASGLLRLVSDAGEARLPERLREGQVTGLVVSRRQHLEAAVYAALEQDQSLLLLNGQGPAWPANGWAELAGAPDLRLLRDAVRLLREHRREGDVDLVHFGGVRSGTDAAKLIGLGAAAMVLGVSAGLAAGGHVQGAELAFDADLGAEERASAVANLVRANCSEASMMARCCGKTVLHNIEPEDLRALTLATSESTGVPLAGQRG